MQLRSVARCRRCRWRGGLPRRCRVLLWVAWASACIMQHAKHFFLLPADFHLIEPFNPSACNRFLPTGAWSHPSTHCSTCSWPTTS